MFVSTLEFKFLNSAFICSRVDVIYLVFSIFNIYKTYQNEKIYEYM